MEAAAIIDNICQWRNPKIHVRLLQEPILEKGVESKD